MGASHQGGLSPGGALREKGAWGAFSRGSLTPGGSLDRQAGRGGELETGREGIPHTQKIAVLRSAGKQYVYSYVCRSRAKRYESIFELTDNTGAPEAKRFGYIFSVNKQIENACVYMRL